MNFDLLSHQLNADREAQLLYKISLLEVENTTYKNFVIQLNKKLVDLERENVRLKAQQFTAPNPLDFRVQQTVMPPGRPRTRDANPGGFNPRSKGTHNPLEALFQRPTVA